MPGWSWKTGFLGMAMPVVDFKPGDHRPHISFGGTVSRGGRVPVGHPGGPGRHRELAEVEAILWQLAEELKRTIRRTNALNYMIIPTYRETIHYLEGALEDGNVRGCFT